MEEIVESRFALEQPAESVDEIMSALDLGDEKKAEVLISLLGIFHANIASWTTRSFQAATWATGITLAVVSYTFIHSEGLTSVARVILSTGLFALGISIQLYLRAASRAHSGNRLAISKCEGALGLYQVGKFLKERAFFVYSKDMQTSKSLEVTILFHMLVAILSVFFVLFGALFV